MNSGSGNRESFPGTGRAIPAEDEKVDVMSGEREKRDQRPASVAREEMLESAGRKAERKMKSRREGDRGLWYGLGMFGLVGWSVAIPTLIGIAIGAWIDARYPNRFSWTLMLLFLGVILGCFNAWYWVRKETRRD
jgi:ATP synthase protein I